MQITNKLATSIISLILSLVSASVANAGTIKGASTLLDTSSELQLETWLGKASLNLTNIFTKTSENSTAMDFHLAVDGKGPTFIIMAATDNFLGITSLIGGYNPGSWTSQGIRQNFGSAFLFNLSENVYLPQGLSSPFNDFYGSSDHGPQFGLTDLSVYSDLTRASSQLIGYGIQNHQFQSLADLINRPSHGELTISSLEVFSVSAVPEPPTYALLLAGLGLISLISGKKRIH